MLFSRISRILKRNYAAGLKLLNNDYSTDPTLSFTKKSGQAPALRPLFEEQSEHVVRSNLFVSSLLLNAQNSATHPSRQILDLPHSSTFGVFHLPTNLIFPKEDVISSTIIDAPSLGRNEEKRAARLIVIRRRKMKKHKLRKLRKKMKFEWAKVRQRRELRKEKAFQAELILQIKQAEAFEARQYVTEKLHQAQEKKLPKKWKGRRLPEFIIKQKLGIKD